MSKHLRRTQTSPGLQKCPTGIRGLDEVMQGGLPSGRPTLVCGGPGCGKTQLAMAFLVNGARELNEPGVFIAFEESAEELQNNFASLGYGLDALIAEKKLVVDFVHVERSEIQETGEYDLEGLFIRIEHAINSIGAKRVVIDTLETLYAGLTNTGILRAELRRLMRWLKQKGMTAIITAEKGDGALTRHGIEEYVSDCVILLDNRVENQIATRRLQLVKYRGSAHGGDEYPFIIDQTGVSVLPITSLSLDHPVSEERISTGVKRLDAMLGGKGYFKGCTILISGTSGTGKTSLSVSAVDAACRRGQKCVYLAFEESPDQIIRNMKSVGIDLGKWVKKGLLRFFANRPTSCGLEMHLLAMHKAVDAFQPDLVVADPISSLMKAGSGSNTPFMVLRLIDFLKSKSITVVLVSLTQGGSALEATNAEISSLVDTWILLRDIEIGGERNRGLYVLKSRGMDHSNQIREFKLSKNGLDLLDVYAGPEGVLTGSARIAQEARERAQAQSHKQELRRKRADLEKRHAALKAQMEALRAESASLKDEMEVLTVNEEAHEKEQTSGRAALASARRAD